MPLKNSKFAIVSLCLYLLVFSVGFLVSTAQADVNPSVVATGDNHSCSLEGSEVICWGKRQSNQYGNG